MERANVWSSYNQDQIAELEAPTNALYKHCPGRR